MDNAAYRPALLQHPEHFVVVAIEAKETLERAVIGEIGRLPEPQPQRLPTRAMSKRTQHRPFRFGQRPRDGDDVASVIPRDYHRLGNDRRRGAAISSRIFVAAARHGQSSPETAGEDTRDVFTPG